jgi:hypothetical protein
VELLGAGIQVVELKCALASAIATDAAFSTGLLDELALDRSPPTSDPLESTALTSVIAATLKHELRHPMLPTSESCLSSAVVGNVMPMGTHRQAIPRDPMTNRAEASINS